MHALTFVILFTASWFLGFLFSAMLFADEISDYEDLLFRRDTENKILKMKLTLNELVASQPIVEETGECDSDG